MTELGLTRNAGGEMQGVDPRTSRRSAGAERDIAPPASLFLRYPIRVGADPTEVRAMPDAEEDSRQRARRRAGGDGA